MIGNPPKPTDAGPTSAESLRKNSADSSGTRWLERSILRDADALHVAAGAWLRQVSIQSGSIMNLATIFPLSIVDEVPNPHELKSSMQLKLVGGNYGNLAFRYATNRLLNYDLRPWVSGAMSSDLLLATAANWITPSGATINADLMTAARSASRFVIFGMGAQAGLGVSPSEFVARMAAAAKDRLIELCSLTTVMGVRDDFTRDLLAELGVSNTMVLGCLSNFINLSPDIGQDVIKRCNQDAAQRRAVVTEVTIDVKSRTRTRVHLLKTLSLIRALDADYLLQGRNNIPFVLQETTDISTDLTNGLIPSEIEQLAYVLNRRSRYFTRVPDWLDFYRSRDLVVGSRVHGAILALQARTPAILVTHDIRTAGLGDSLGLPVMSDEEFLEWDGNAADLIQRVRHSMPRYDIIRRRLAADWVRFFDMQGVEFDQQLRALANSTA